MDQQWLLRVIQKMNFPTNFIQIIKSLNNNAHVKVLVNGFQTKNIQIQKDVRQGDPLSLYLFLLAMEPSSPPSIKIETQKDSEKDAGETSSALAMQMI